MEWTYFAVPALAGNGMRPMPKRYEESNNLIRQAIVDAHRIEFGTIKLGDKSLQNKMSLQYIRSNQGCPSSWLVDSKVDPRASFVVKCLVSNQLLALVGREVEARDLYRRRLQ
jgi:hypothetical protein